MDYIFILRSSTDILLLFLAAKCRVDDLRAHFKNTYETARACKGMELLKAIAYIEDVMVKKNLIPFRRFTGGPGRHAMCKNIGHHNGRYPYKSSKHVLGLLNNLKSNAEAQSLDPEKCVITHVCTQRAVSGRRRTYRAHGRISPYLSSNCHVEFHVTEKSDQVERADKAQVRVTKK